MRPPRLRVLVMLCAAAGLAASGCNQMMNDEPRYKPLAASDFFADGQSARPQVAGTVAVREIVEGRRGRLPFHGGGDDVEVLVVPLDEVQRPVRSEILAVVARHVADAHPQRHVAVPLHDRLNGVEFAVNIAERADSHLSRGWRLGAGG